MKLTIVEKNLLSWTAMHIDFVMCKKQCFMFPVGKKAVFESKGVSGYFPALQIR